VILTTGTMIATGVYNHSTENWLASEFMGNVGIVMLYDIKTIRIFWADGYIYDYASSIADYYFDNYLWSIL